MDKLSAIRQKGESQNGCYKKKSTLNTLKNEHFLPPDTNTHVSNVRFLENLACFFFFNTRFDFEIHLFALLPTKFNLNY